MAFMRASISNNHETWLVTEQGDCEIRTVLPSGSYYDLDEDDLAQIAHDLFLDIEDVRDDYNAALKEANDREFTICTGYRGWLSASGCLDRTPVVIADTVAEVARHLLDMYYDGSLEDMDDSELEDALWLSDLCDLQSQVEEIQAEIDRR